MSDEEEYEIEMPFVTVASVGVEIRIISVDEFRAWHNRGLGIDYAAEARRDGPPFTFVEGRGFRWTCPDCGEPHFSRIGDEPISGWDNPQWVLSGTPESPSATPSLGCGRMKQEPGHHWWLRDGRLVPA